GNPGPGPGPGPGPESCQVTFKYVNADTCASTGGTQDWPVYVIGDMNEWQPADGNMIMNADANCVRTATINVEKGKNLKYKFFVAGWEQDSYRSDPSKSVDDDQNNQTDGTCGATYEYIEKAATTVVDPGSGEVKDGDCEATFTYFNEYTNTNSGGADNFDVYLVGSFNTESDGTWKTNDYAWKMKSDNYGTHTITVKLKKGETYEYKYYVNGWENDSWKTDAEDGESNGKATMDSCGKKFGKGNPGGIVVPPSDPNKCQATFVYENKWTNVNGDGSPASFDVYLVGSFNTESDGTWKTTDPNYKMKSDGKGTHTITVELKQGEKYAYKYYVKDWGDDSYRANPAECSDNDCNSLADMSTCGKVFKYVEVPAGGGETPNPPVQSTGKISLKSQPKVDGKKIEFEVNIDSSIQADSITISGGKSPKLENGKVTDTVDDNNKYSYILKSGDEELYVPVWVEDKPFDWHDATLYFAFTDRFLDGDSGNNNPKTNASVAGSSNAQWMGGDFKGLQKKVDDGYFDKLGINTLWISSVSMNAQGTSQGTNGDEAHWYSAYHSYWPVASFMTDYNQDEFAGAKSEGQEIKAIEPHFGTMEDLKALVDSCHKHGIRVLVDFAANQVHKDSPIFKNHGDWFNDVNSPWLCDSNNGWDNYSEKCWFSQDLPDINYENDDARRTMVDHAIWLIKQTNIDGFRVDAVKHMNIKFVKDLRAATDKLFANTGIMFYMVGETFTGDVGLLNKYIGNDLLHAQFDFPMYFALKSHVLGLGNYADVAQLSNTFNSDLMGTFMGNHDVARALSVAAGQNQNKWGSNDEVHDWLPYLKVKTALTILLTNPGVPLIYYGDEYGMEGSNDPDNRRMMAFDDKLNNEQKEMLSYVRMLGQIRKTHKAITRGHRENLSYGGGYWCYKLVKEGEPAVIVGISRADGGDNSGCDLKGNYNLKSLLNDKEFSTSSLDLSSDRLQVYEVK
ncbi:MAG: hypothetical protein IJU23_03770, partial [Proteobacteria bacterium]|nr:hypothetical protein [Pseudomonadota bacterium]